MREIAKDQIAIIESLYAALQKAAGARMSHDLGVDGAVVERQLIERFLYEANFPPTEHNYKLVSEALHRQEPVTNWLNVIDQFPGMRIMGDENSFRFFLHDFVIMRGTVYAHDVLAFLGCPRDGVAEELVEKWAHREISYADFLERLDERVQNEEISPHGERRVIYPLRGIHVFQCVEEGYPKVDMRVEDGSVRHLQALFTTESSEIPPSQFLPVLVDAETVEMDGIPVAFTAAVIHQARHNPLLIGRQFVFHFTSEERLVFDENGEFQYVTASQVA